MMCITVVRVEYIEIFFLKFLDPCPKLPFAIGGGGGGLRGGGRDGSRRRCDIQKNI